MNQFFQEQVHKIQDLKIFHKFLSHLKLICVLHHMMYHMKKNNDNNKDSKNN